MVLGIVEWQAGPQRVPGFRLYADHCLVGKREIGTVTGPYCIHSRASFLWVDGAHPSGPWNCFLCPCLRFWSFFIVLSYLFFYKAAIMHLPGYWWSFPLLPLKSQRLCFKAWKTKAASDSPWYWVSRWADCLHVWGYSHPLTLALLLAPYRDVGVF